MKHRRHDDFPPTGLLIVGIMAAFYVLCRVLL